MRFKIQKMYIHTMSFFRGKMQKWKFRSKSLTYMRKVFTCDLVCNLVDTVE